jgi:hypothetical protein
MYGIINKAIEELVKENYGEKTWEQVKQRSGVDIDYFLFNKPYDDEITYQLVTAVANEINQPLGDVFQSLGEWWILKTGQKNYGALIKSGGDNLKEFLQQLPAIHNRAMLYFPKLSPPKFKITDEEANSLHIHYLSKRPGLRPFVKGLLQGLGIMFEKPVTVELLESSNEEDNYERFKVSW